MLHYPAPMSNFTLINATGYYACIYAMSQGNAIISTFVTKYSRNTPHKIDINLSLTARIIKINRKLFISYIISITRMNKLDSQH